MCAANAEIIEGTAPRYVLGLRAPGAAGLLANHRCRLWMGTDTRSGDADAGPVGGLGDADLLTTMRANPLLAEGHEVPAKFLVLTLQCPGPLALDHQIGRERPHCGY